MTYTYKLLPNNIITGQESNCILRVEDNVFIPKVQGNRYYQEYLEWLAEGNEPEPADEV